MLSSVLLFLAFPPPAQGGFMQFYSGKCTPIVCKTVFVHFSKGLWLGMQKRSISGLRYWVYGTCLSSRSVTLVGTFCVALFCCRGFHKSIDRWKQFFLLSVATCNVSLPSPQPLHRAALHFTRRPSHILISYFIIQ